MNYNFYSCDLIIHKVYTFTIIDTNATAECLVHKMECLKTYE